MKAIDLGLDAVITSRLLRARQTAEIVAEALNVAVSEDPRLAGGFSIDHLGAILAPHRDASAIMLVGHEPTFSTTISRLIGGGSIDMKKGTLARVDLHDTRQLRGELVWLIPPKILAY